MELKNQILFSSAGFYGQNHKAIILFLIIVFSGFFLHSIPFEVCTVHCQFSPQGDSLIF